MNEFINEGSFQEFDYNNETDECEWKQKRNPSCKCKDCKCNKIIPMEDLFNGE